MVVSGGAYLTAFSTRCSTIWRSRGGSARACSRGAPLDRDLVAAEQRPERAQDLARRGASTSTGLTARRVLGHDPDRGEDGVDEAVEALDLLERRAVPRGARLAPLDVARLAAGAAGGSSASRSA